MFFVSNILRMILRVTLRMTLRMTIQERIRFGVQRFEVQDEQKQEEQTAVSFGLAMHSGRLGCSNWLL